MKLFYTLLFILIFSVSVFAQSNKLVEIASNAVVTIIAEGNTKKDIGSGFVVNQDGYILTNNHVVGTDNNIKVNLEGKEFKAQVIDADKKLDLALLKIDATNIPVVRIGDSSKVEKTEEVFAIGSPLGLNQTVTKGIVGNKERKFKDINYIQLDLVLNPGNSGGPLVNDNGEVIGINTFIEKETTDYGFALPINAAFDMLRANNVSVVAGVDNPINNIDKNTKDNSSDKSALKDSPNKSNKEDDKIEKGNKMPYLLASGVLILLVIGGFVVYFLKRKKQKTVLNNANQTSEPVNNYDDININLNTATQRVDTPENNDSYDDIDIELK